MLIVILSVVPTACVQSSGPPPTDVATGSLTIDGATHSLSRIQASTNADASEYVDGRIMNVRAFVDAPVLEVFIDLGDVAATVQTVRPFAAPDVVVRTEDGVITYRAYEANLEIKRGSLEEGDTLELSVEGTFIDPCAPSPDARVDIVINIATPVDRLLEQEVIDLSAPIAGSVVTTFTPPGGVAMDYVGILDGSTRTLGGQPAWFLGAVDACVDDDTAWLFTLGIPLSTPVDEDFGGVAMLLDEVDPATNTKRRTWAAANGSIFRTLDPIVDEPGARARATYTNVTMFEVDAQGQAVAGGSQFAIDEVRIDAALVDLVDLE